MILVSERVFPLLLMFMLNESKGLPRWSYTGKNEKHHTIINIKDSLALNLLIEQREGQKKVAFHMGSLLKGKALTRDEYLKAVSAYH